MFVLYGIKSEAFEEGLPTLRLGSGQECLECQVPFEPGIPSYRICFFASTMACR
jgi:hypothetical protein